MNEQPPPPDPFEEIELRLRKAKAETANLVEASQKAHAACEASYSLVASFNSERRPLMNDNEHKIRDAFFTTISGAPLLDLATGLHNPYEPFSTAVRANLMLSGLQSNVAAYVSTQIELNFEKTVKILKSQNVPLDDQLTSLKKRVLPRFEWEHFTGLWQTGLP